MLPGVYTALKKNGDTIYRSSLTYQRKHVSLGSFETEQQAYQAYLEASNILKNSKIEIEDYKKSNTILSFQKWIILLNFRDNHIYIKTPVYLKNKYFLYYLDPHTILTFDVDDLFYYSKHSIQKKGGYLFVADYGMQINILSRYGIKNFAVEGKDYYFSNGNHHDFRYENIIILHKYYGVSKTIKNDKTVYSARILVNGYLMIGYYETEIIAAIAYNKAAATLLKNGINRNFSLNYIEEIDSETYRKIYKEVKISKKIKHYVL